MPLRGASVTVAVVADDLTGAADTAVQFLRDGDEIFLPLTGVVPAYEVAAPPAPRCAGLAIDTATRGSGRAEAIRRIEQAAAMVRRFRPGLVYHKIDSQLRGRPGLEIETLRRELGRPCALVAPAHPGQDRVTVAGVHRVRGVPVAEAEPGRDPVAPVTDSRLPVLIASQAGVKVAHVPLAELEGDPRALHRQLESLLAAGYPILTFDATSPQHLRRIAELSANHLPDALLVGSAGLAAAVAEVRRTGSAPPSAAIPACASMLFVCGSTAASLHRQLARLVESGRCRRAILTAPSLAEQRHHDELRLAAGDAWERCDLAVQTPEDRLAASTATPVQIGAALADLAVDLVRRRKPDAVLLTGGDTARAVLAAAGVRAIRFRGEVIPGVPWGVAVGGALDGVVLVTKSGAFGGDEDLVDVHRRCRRDTAHEE